MKDIHRILRRQLRRTGCSADEPPTPEQWASFMHTVDAAYKAADEDRYTLERSLGLSSREMEELHLQVSAERTRLDALLSGLSEAVLQIGPEGVIRWTNAAGRTLLGRSDLVGLPFAKVAPLVYESSGTVVELAVEAASGPRRITDARLALDQPLPVEVSVSPMDDGGLVVGLSDLTEIVSTRADLWQARRETETAKLAERAKSMFLANMSHELRTPLNAIIGYSELLAEDLVDEDEGWIADLGRIESAGRHLLALINDILDLSKIEAGKVELYREQTDLAAWVRDLGAEVGPLMAPNGNTLHVEVPSVPISGWVDPFRLKQCALNLIGNAAKFTSNGEVHVALRVREGVLELTVRDTGIGMTADQIEAVFDEFTQAEATTTRRFGGTGLGLTLTRRIMRLMGGEVQVDSTPGVGSIFTLQLGLGSAPDAPLSKTFTPSGPDLGLSVLVIDDDPSVHDLFGRHLSKEGYTVITAGHGSDGVRLAIEHKPDAITLDVMMPEVDGWTVLAQLRAEPLTRDIPIVLVTLVEERQRAFSLGADGYLAKPVSGRQLVDMLEHHGLAPSRASTVMVVDDDPVVRRMLQVSLERAGYAVIEAEDGRQGLARLEQHQPDLILLDLMMPKLDGFGFLEQFRTRRDLPQVPVFVLTAAALDDFERGWLDARVAQVIEKSPASIRRVLEELDRSVGRSADRRESPTPVAP